MRFAARLLRRGGGPASGKSASSVGATEGSWLKMSAGMGMRPGGLPGFRRKLRPGGTGTVALPERVTMAMAGRESFRSAGEENDESDEMIIGLFRIGATTTDVGRKGAAG